MRRWSLMVVAVLSVATAWGQGVQPMFGSPLLPGYDFATDNGPKGSVVYDPLRNEFRGYYVGLRLPAGRRALFAWAYDTARQKARLLGPVGLLNPGARGQTPQRFVIRLPATFNAGRFGHYELMGFSAEKTGHIAGGVVVTSPDTPSGIDGNPRGSPAFYLFSALPGADTQMHFCGHGRDFFYARALEKQVCYDCICGQKYAVCKAAGLKLH